jgi:GNAT superfamily N-acetyltransferase
VQLVVRLFDLIEDWIHIMRRDQDISALTEVTREILQLPYRRIRYVFVARSLVKPLSDLKPKCPLEIRPFEPGDLEFVRKGNRPSEAKLCARRLEYRHFGLVACIENCVAGYAWACTDTKLEKIGILLAPGDVLCTDAFTFPAFRRRGVQSSLSLGRLRFFQDSNYKRAVAYIEAGNRPSLSVWQKLGAAPIAEIDFTRIGLWRKTRRR